MEAAPVCFFSMEGRKPRSSSRAAGSLHGRHRRGEHAGQNAQGVKLDENITRLYLNLDSMMTPTPRTRAAGALHGRHRRGEHVGPSAQAVELDENIIGSYLNL